MTVLLVLLTFVTFLLIDHFHSRKQVAVQPALQAKPKAPPRLAPSLVGGFQVPEKLRFHPGHTWALSESPSLVRIGMDEFASKLTGKLDRIALPQRGQWIRQGQKVWTLHRDGASVDMVSPIEGSVADINEAAVRNPELARNDPYGEGWLVTVQSPDAKTNFRNLLGEPWPAGGRRSRPAGCNAGCRWRLERSRRMVAWRWTTWQRSFPTRIGPPGRKSSSCRNGP